MSSLSFTLDGAPVEVSDISPNTTVGDWLRSIGKTGTKQGCSEGDCGACTIVVSDRDAHGKPCYRSLNSCIALLPMIAGREVLTVEGLDGHPVQDAMVRNHGSQCGYCTPG